MRGSHIQASSIVGVSRSIRDIVELVDTVAATVCGVLIEGESGTGKELVARRLYEKSPRRNKPFIPVNCASISDTLFESQFFGHVRGAFTGAAQEMLGLIRAADGGTLFMDEVGEIPLSIQPKLLRVFQDGELIPVGTITPVRADTRFLAATNRNLQEEVRRGRFRDDLFYRLNIVRIYIPPLRQRPEDVCPLLDHFLAMYAERYTRPAIRVDSAVRSRLRVFAWPGNVRELASWVERLYATGLKPAVLADRLLADATTSAEPTTMPESVVSLSDAEQWAIRRAMDLCHSSLPRAAALLQIHRSTLWRKLKEYRIN